METTVQFITEHCNTSETNNIYVYNLKKIILFNSNKISSHLRMGRNVYYGYINKTFSVYR